VGPADRCISKPTQATCGAFAARMRVVFGCAAPIWTLHAKLALLQERHTGSWGAL